MLVDTVLALPAVARLVEIDSQTCNRYGTRASIRTFLLSDFLPQHRCDVGEQMVETLKRLVTRKFF